MIASQSQPEIKIDRQPKQITFCKEPLSKNVALELVQIPAGEFLMGSPEDELDRIEGRIAAAPCKSIWFLDGAISGDAGTMARSGKVSQGEPRSQA